MEYMVSVIIPTYNRADIIKASIDSVLAQTYDNFELIVVDDASTDGTEETVRSIGDDRIKFIKHNRNRGASAARNTGIKNARGQYIAFLDSDDLWLAEKLEMQTHTFKEASPETGIVYCNVLTVKRNKMNGNIFDKILVHNFVGTASVVVVKKTCLEKAGLFDEDLPSCNDWDMWILRCTVNLSISARNWLNIKHNLTAFLVAEGQ